MTASTIKITWPSYLMKDLYIPQPSLRVLLCDNIRALYLTINPVFHARTKHVKIDYHHIREQVKDTN